MNLYPTILTSSMATAEEQLALIKDNPKINVVQVDIIDGLFSDNLTIIPTDLVFMDFGDLKLDLHLQVEEPMDTFLEIESLANDLPIRSVIAQIERMTYQEDFLLEVKRKNWKAGLSVDIFTPVDEIDERSWDLLDVVQIMGIEAGAQGREFNELALEKITAVVERAQREDREIEIIVDGGIKLDNYKKILMAGATGLAVGSELWKSNDIESTIKGFYE